MSKLKCMTVVLNRASKVLDLTAPAILVVLLILISWGLTVSIMNTGDYIEEYGLKSIVSDIWLGSEAVADGDTIVNIENPNEN